MSDVTDDAHDIERGWVILDFGLGAQHIQGTDTHEVDSTPILCANCSRHFLKGERYSMGLRGDPDGAGPRHGVGPARPVCRACRPFVTSDELALVDFATLPRWLLWLVEHGRTQ